jgi:hypothetical protein
MGFQENWMRSHGEGKLLARVEGFFITLGERAEQQGPMYFARNLLWFQKMLALFAGPALRFTPIRVREKRMNTHKTLLAGRKLSKYKQINCKNIFTSMESFFLARHHRSKGRNVSARVMGCVAKAN